MSNVKLLIADSAEQEQEKIEAIAIAEQLLDDLKSGKIKSFAACGVTENLTVEFYLAGQGKTNSTVIMGGSVSKLLHWLQEQ